MVMYEENARKVNAALAAANPAARLDIIPLGRVGSMLQVRQRLLDGAIVGILGDRTLGGDDTISVSFLGAPAALPTGPFRLAAMLRQPVHFMAGVYLGQNRYRIHFEALADFSVPKARGARCRPARSGGALRRGARAALPRGAVQLVQFLRFLAAASGDRHGPKGASVNARTSVLAFLSLSLVALIASAAATAAEWNVAKLMQDLAQQRGGKVFFSEKKYIALLDRPVESSGELVYQPPARLEKRTLKPKVESLVLDGDMLVVERGKQKYTLQLQQYPEIAAIVGSHPQYACR